MLFIDSFLQAHPHWANTCKVALQHIHGAANAYPVAEATEIQLQQSGSIDLLQRK